MKKVFKKLVVFALSIGVYICYASCSILFPVKGNGNIETWERKLPKFEKIYSSGTAEVRFHTSTDTYRVEVTVDENLSEYVEVFSKNRTLNIRTKIGHSCSFTTFLVDVYCPVLSGVSISGSGSFESIDNMITSSFESNVSGSGKIEGTIDCSNFSARISGSGQISVSGKSTDFDVIISGSGHFNGDDFQVKNAYANISGSGNVNICVEEYLTARISGSGIIGYYGDPTVDSKISGSGKVRKM